MQSRAKQALLAAKETNMQMIDVLKRLAELDAQNPNIIKESTQVEECGMVPEMGLDMMPPMETKPSQPASINMTAGSGEELGDLLTTIMSLAGVAKQGNDSPVPPVSSEPAAQTLEPATGPESPADTMRSVIDKLNPMDGDDDGQEVGAPDTVTKAMGDQDDDGDHDEQDHELEKDNEEDKEEVDEYDNSPADPNNKPAFDANKFAHKENQPGQGDRMDGDRPKAYADMTEAVSDLFAQYKKFVNEN